MEDTGWKVTVLYADDDADFGNLVATYLEREATEVVSHDLRNPLNVADGFVDVAQETGEVDRLDRVSGPARRSRTSRTLGQCILSSTRRPSGSRTYAAHARP